MIKLYMGDYIKLFVISVAFVLFLSSCEYSPSDIPLTKIEQLPPPDIGIILNPEMDTVRLACPTYIGYQINVSYRDVYALRFLIDDITIADIQSDNLYNLGDTAVLLSFYVNTYDFIDGVHELKLKIYTATHTGSIADKVKSEAYVYEHRWPMLINSDARNNFKFLDLKLDPEGIRLSWPKYDYADFRAYAIERYSNIFPYKQVLIQSPDTNTYHDDISLIEGGNIEYYIKLIDIMYTPIKDKITYSIEIESPEVFVNDDCTFDVKWRHSMYEQNVKSYNLIFYSNDSYYKDETITDLNDTIFHSEYRLSLGKDYYVQLRYMPNWYNNLPYSLNVIGGKTEFALGDKMVSFKVAKPVDGEDCMLFYNDTIITKYNLITGDYIDLNIKSSNDVNRFRCSPDGNYFGYYQNDRFVLCRTRDMREVNVVDSPHGIISLSNNKIMSEFEDSSLIVYNIETSDTIVKKQSNNLKNVVISGDGENLAVKYYSYDHHSYILVYYRISNNSLEKIDSVMSVTTLGYSSDKYRKLYYTCWKDGSRHFELRDSHSFELIYSYKISYDFVVRSYDFASDLFITTNRFIDNVDNGYDYLVNKNTGTKKKIVHIQYSELPILPTVFFDGIIYSGNGRYIKADDCIIE